MCNAHSLRRIPRIFSNLATAVVLLARIFSNLATAVVLLTPTTRLGSSDSEIQRSTSPLLAMALTRIPHLVFILSSSFLSLASSLLFQSLQSASPVYKINIPYYVPEGLAYHEATDRIIIPSLATGAIRSFPNTNQLDSISEQGSTLLYSGSFNGTNTPIVGIKVYGDTLYGAVGAIPPLPGPFYGGLLILDLQSSSSNVQLVDFSPLYGGTLMTPNDVVYSSYANAIFVTDFYGYRVFKYDLATSVQSLPLPPSLYLSEPFSVGYLCDSNWWCSLLHLLNFWHCL